MAADSDPETEVFEITDFTTASEWERYGIQEFLVISPGANCEVIISESKCNLLLSSVSISLANSG
ncbi:hypothetical protein CRUP_011877, partial [Coryphaenoides rupestris]